MNAETLDAALLAAHEAGDRAALIRLYMAASEAAETPQAQSFYLTHAYVFALEAGAPEAADLRQRLRDMGAI
ncbi:hypothetical protein E2K80_08235 [Rhodophyticola sp. CCM32]|uniref:hypothetical protein n=1 Tax=Rhodophyticola sp. CCM32 TaxID=2916397 RepID=UPI00107F1756|nr:hypothetical protein [Rhodophyticola sp. CCM32]QBY00722.1 hypothetical protein E2K80_08235 [Rhodophyticola sp. CCM32]